ncbi:glycosyltransferase BC10 [Rhodamnia argentea]|uniref:Glycosyltransferase BC10 n=1 Tax=Rhodamnia argentea TaxID=178133 RepID=A0A8B8MTG8_9MYRT|nr:glycosyltransferase BC10 [Rhodamnia argentea]
MKSSKITVCVKELTVRIGRDRSFHVTTTIIFCLSMAFVAIGLGMYIHDHIKRVIISDEFYSTQLSPLLALAPTSAFSNSSLAASSPIPFERAIGRAGPDTSWHSMSDEELAWRASMVPRILEYPYNRTPKVAFMFLSRGRLPLAPLWERFFKGHQNLYSIYLHMSVDLSNDEMPETSVFYRRRIPSKPAQWGRASMMDAERRLLANALLDFSNERFVLLSETCIPLFNFTMVYSYLINSNQSFLGSFDDPRPMGRGRYNKRMWPTVLLSEWRKGSQWFEVHRRVAVDIVSDVTYYPVFRDHCKPPCYMDEHYLPTLVTKVCPGANSNRSITWVDWSRGGSHPTTFTRTDMSQVFLERIRHGFNCTYNGIVTSICFLFTRKFHPNTLQPLLKIAPPLLGFVP